MKLGVGRSGGKSHQHSQNRSTALPYLDETLTQLRRPVLAYQLSISRGVEAIASSVPDAVALAL
jgi:hypothetical protein